MILDLLQEYINPADLHFEQQANLARVRYKQKKYDEAKSLAEEAERMLEKLK